MKYLNTGLVCEQSGLSCVELPKICIPVYREVIKEMAEVIKDSQMRDVFYSLSTGIDILAVSKKQVLPLGIWHICIKSEQAGSFGMEILF